MKRLITRLFLRLEYSGHMIDAYLSDMRGEYEMAQWSFCRAKEAERRLCWMAMQ